MPSRSGSVPGVAVLLVDELLKELELYMRARIRRRYHYPDKWKFDAVLLEMMQQAWNTVAKGCTNQDFSVKRKKSSSEGSRAMAKKTKAEPVANIWESHSKPN